MKNKAKCKLCKDVIESFHSTDYVMCSCGEIFVDGGDALKCGCKDWNNFLRVDEDGNEITVTIEESHQPLLDKGISNKKRILFELECLLENIQKLPENAMLTPINHYDYASLLMVLVALFKEERISSN